MSKSLKGMRKRILVNEMELFDLYAGLREVQNQERSRKFMKDFRKLLKEAEFVNFEVQPKKGDAPSGAEGKEAQDG